MPIVKGTNVGYSTTSSIASSQSCEQLDSYEVKRFIDLGDSCSSFSSSIDSIDRQTDISSNESFDMIEKSPLAIAEKPPPPSPSISSSEHATNDECDDFDKDPVKKDEGTSDCKKESVLFSNENTLTVSTSSSSSSNEGLTLTTNSPNELSPKQEANKRTRKTSWIQSANAYPATLDKLLNLFHHPSSIFTKTSPESTLASSPSSSSSLTTKPPVKQPAPKENLDMGPKENSISGFIHSLVSLTSHKKEVSSSSESSILQNISPQNTIEKTSSQMLLESLPRSVKNELKENISPENTISCENYAAVESLQPQQKSLGSKVLFLVGDDEMCIDESISSAEEELNVENDNVFASPSLGEITRDSMSILKPSGDLLEKR